MLKLLGADCYKAFHRVYFYVILASLSGVAILLNALMAHAHQTAESAVGTAGMLLAYPLFVICLFADITTAEENKEHTLKNTVAFGVPRSKVYLAKTASTMLLGLVTAAVTLAVFVGSAYALMPSKGGFADLVSATAPYLGTAVLIYLAACALATLLAFVIRKNALFSITYFGLLIVPTLLFKLLSLAYPIFSKAEDAMLYRQAQLIVSVPPAQLTGHALLALAYIAVFIFAGLLLFDRQEIN